ncbi:MAG: carboxypeptidase regulatory-like domain-containing protein, partial [Bacteroidia bacterium]|nr:carboxypeptidase regulatory-like domain-containing protein [Bacteroidia bacterium]
GYITAVRKEGLGDQDIYRITFNDVEAKQTVLRGNCGSTDLVKKVAQVSITVTDTKTTEIYGTYLSNVNSNKYIMILPAGTYEVSIEAAGFKTIEKTITILDKSDYVPEIEQDLMLTPSK